MVIELFSVAGGKYHKPAAGAVEPANAWRPTLTACGRTVTPENYFETAAEAERWTGGRLAHWLCRHCSGRAAATCPVEGCGQPAGTACTMTGCPGR